MENKTTDFNISISNLDEDTTLVTSIYDKNDERLRMAIAEYSPDNEKYSVYLNEGQKPRTDITLSDIDDWAISPQTSLTKILQINAYIRKLINCNDIIGKVVESINTNINTEHKLTYSHQEVGRNKKKRFNEAVEFIDEFNDSINLRKIIRNAPTTCYEEGSWICYLRHEDPNNYQVDVYPLGVAEITNYLVNGEPVVQFNVQQLRTRLQKTYRKTKKNKALFFENIDAEIKANYPAEVYEAFKAGEQYVNLDPKYTGVIRINNQNRQYGVSPILRCMADLVMLDQLRDTDDTNAKAKGKKIIHQKMRKELIADDPRRDTFPQQAYAHKNFCDAWKQKTVVVTTPPYIESITYVTDDTELTPVNTYNYYRSKVLNTLGIGFLMDSSSQSVSTASISVTQLMRTINSITEQLETVLWRFYRQALIDNGYEYYYAPKISIIDSEMLEADLKREMAMFLYSTLGVSRQTTFELVGLDINDEAAKRKAENDAGMNEIFMPYGTSYTQSGNDTDNTGGRPTGDDETKDAKQSYDKERNDNISEIVL